jgi:hypothetical protein
MELCSIQCTQFTRSFAPHSRHDACVSLELTPSERSEHGLIQDTSDNELRARQCDRANTWLALINERSEADRRDMYERSEYRWTTNRSTLVRRANNIRRT